ncbi:glutamate--tRNA ligase isoform X4 [Stomoxys calcitrans]|nr:glutamate--tRNA ligase isoform X4 [Stomoxys calcitrans]
MSKMLTSADIEDGKVEVDPKTGVKTEYFKVEGGYSVKTTTPQPNGGWKSSTQTYYDPKPMSEEDMKKQMEAKKTIKTRMNKEIRIDERTTMLTREIEGGYEEVYTTINEDGSKSVKTKTFFDAVPEGTPFPDGAHPKPAGKQVATKKTTSTRKASIESTDSTDSRKMVQKFNKNTTVEESRSITQNFEITEEHNRTVRKNSLQTEQTIKSITNVTDGSSAPEKKKKVKKTKTQAPPPPADFVQNDTTSVSTKTVPGGIEYIYTTTLESGKTITTSKTVYEEEESELTEEEIKAYKKALKDAEKHKNITTTKKLKSESGTKKVVPSENPGDVTTVETIKIQGGTEYHYTTVTSEGIVKKAVKTVYDPVPCSNPDDTEEEEIIEEYEEEIIEPGEKNIRTIETIKTLPQTFEEEVTFTHEKKEKKTKKSMTVKK